MKQKSKSYCLRRSSKRKLVSKIHLPTPVTQWWIPPRKYFNWINVGYRDMTNKRSYISFSFNTLYASFHRGFPFSLTWFYATSWANLSLSSSFSEGEMSSLKNQHTFYHQLIKMQKTTNRAHNHYYFTLKRTTLDNQVLSF